MTQRFYRRGTPPALPDNGRYVAEEFKRIEQAFTTLPGADLSVIETDIDNLQADVGTLQSSLSGHIGSGGTAHANVIASGAAGFMTGADKAKLDGIAAGADVTSTTNVGSSINAAAAKTTPVDADTVALIDSAASNVLKKLSWANIKATLKSYFDTLYAPIGAGSGLAWVDVTAYGAVGDGSTDNAAAFAAALAALPNGGVLYFPAGHYRTSAAIPISNKSVQVLGDGLASVIEFTNNASVGLLLNLRRNRGDGFLDTFAVENLRILCGYGGNTGTGLSVVYDVFSTTGEQAGWIKNVEVGYVSGAAFGISLYTQNLNQLEVQNLVLYGDTGSTTNVGWHAVDQVGTLVHGLQIEGFNVGLRIQGTFPTGTGTGATGGVEGFRISNFFIYNSKSMAVWVDNALDLMMTNGHLLSIDDYVFRARNCSQSSFSNILCYNFGSNPHSVGAAWQMAQNDGGHAGDVITNTFTNLTIIVLGSAMGGFYIEGGSSNIVSNLVVQQATTAISLGTSTSHCMVNGAITRSCSTPTNDVGTSNTLVNIHSH